MTQTPTHTEEAVIAKATQQLKDIVPGHNMQGLLIASPPEMLIKIRGTAVTQVKITFVFELDEATLSDSAGDGWQIPK